MLFILLQIKEQIPRPVHNMLFFIVCMFETLTITWTHENELWKTLSDELKTNIIAWNDIDVRIFDKANETFWEKYNAIPNVKKLEQEFKYETGTIIQTN